MIPIIMWGLWFVSIGVLYVTVLYLIYIKQKYEKRRISQLKVEKDLYMNKNWRDSYVLDKDVEKLEQELERLKRWGIRNQ